MASCGLLGTLWGVARDRAPTSGKVITKMCIYRYRDIWPGLECKRKPIYIYIHRVWHGTGHLQAGRSSPRSVYIQMYIYRYIWLSPECNRKSIYIHRVWHGTGCLQAGRSSPRTVYIDIYIHTHIHTHIHTYTCSCQLPLWVQLTTTLPGSFYPSEQ